MSIPIFGLVHSTHKCVHWSADDRHTQGPPGLLHQVVADFNANPEVHGILVQLPLPKHIDAHRVTDAISLEKDVDGFHPANIGALAMRDRTPLFIPCTPKACPNLPRTEVLCAAACC